MFQTLVYFRVKIGEARDWFYILSVNFRFEIAFCTQQALTRASREIFISNESVKLHPIFLLRHIL